MGWGTRVIAIFTTHRSGFMAEDVAAGDPDRLTFEIEHIYIGMVRLLAFELECDRGSIR